MTPAEWEKICDQVTDAMLVHTKPFVSPLSSETDEEVRLIGTGTFVQGNKLRILTCEHVAREQPIHFRFKGSDRVFLQDAPWTSEKNPIDAAFSELKKCHWNACNHQSNAIPLNRFARSHATSSQAELLFFHGYAGENAAHAFGVHNANGTGYCTQEKKDSGDAEIFELFWEPENTQLSSGTPSSAGRQMLFEVAGGFSGSLVWNTRYVEVTSLGREWTPDDAVVTGLLRRWDEKTKTLLVWRAERFLEWLLKNQA